MNYKCENCHDVGGFWDGGEYIWCLCCNAKDNDPSWKEYMVAGIDKFNNPIEVPYIFEGGCQCNNDEQIIEYVIKDPETKNWIICETFEEAMYKFYEGPNIPFIRVNGKLESYDSAYERVDNYLRNIEKYLMN